MMDEYWKRVFKRNKEVYFDTLPKPVKANMVKTPNEISDIIKDQYKIDMNLDKRFNQKPCK